MTALCITAALVLIAQHMERMKPYRKQHNRFEVIKTVR